MREFLRFIAGGRLSIPALLLTLALAVSVLSCGDSDSRNVHRFRLSVVVTQDLHLKAGSPLDSGLKSILNYYDEPNCPAEMFVPVASFYRMDLNPAKPVEVPLFLSLPAQWREKFKLPLTAYTLKDSYDSQMSDLKTFDVLATQSNKAADLDAVKSQFPDAKELIIKDGATDPDAVKQLRRGIGADLCNKKETFSVILTPSEPPVIPKPPEPKAMLLPVAPPPAPKPTPIVKPPKMTTPSPKPTTQVVRPIIATPVSTPKPTVPSLPKALPPIPAAAKPCYTVQVFSVDNERLEDNPIQDGSSFALDDTKKGNLTKGDLSAKVKPCAPVPPHTEVRLKWTRDGKDQANPPLEPSEADGTSARKLQNFPLPGKYEVSVFVGGIDATQSPFRFTILPRGAGARASSGPTDGSESSPGKESK